MNNEIYTFPRHARGFSLIEVMVALVVCSIGMLGLAKMESLALSSTSVASSRGLAAMQASSMAAAMHANRGYWSLQSVPVTTIVNNTPPNNYATATACTTTGTGACTVTQMAAYDLQQWAASLNALLPGYNATITCATATLPVNCNITIQWVEEAVSANAQQNNLAAIAAPTYVLFVEP
jgi:type IV pilus assembly protein PilV